MHLQTKTKTVCVLVHVVLNSSCIEFVKAISDFISESNYAYILRSTSSRNSHDCIWVTHEFSDMISVFLAFWVSHSECFCRLQKHVPVSISVRCVILGELSLVLFPSCVHSFPSCMFKSLSHWSHTNFFRKLFPEIILSKHLKIENIAFEMFLNF